MQMGLSKHLSSIPLAPLTFNLNVRDQFVVTFSHSLRDESVRVKRRVKIDASVNVHVTSHAVLGAVLRTVRNRDGGCEIIIRFK